MSLQSTPPDVLIQPIACSDFDPFVAYLNDHLCDNGKPGHLHFQPLPRAESIFTAAKASAFRVALDVPLGTPGWRRLWGAFDPERGIIGHIDLRAHPERFAAHRCLLGMGVDRHARQRGLGRLLIEHAQQWAVDCAALEWIDLQVLSVNQPAIRLYQRSGFVTTGEVPDMFEIDDQRMSLTSMSKRLGARIEG